MGGVICEIKVAKMRFSKCFAFKVKAKFRFF